MLVIGLAFSLQQLVHSVLPYFGVERQQSMQKGVARFMGRMPGNITTLRDVIDATPNSGRPAVILAAQRPELHIRLIPGPLPKSIKPISAIDPESRSCANV